MTCLFKVVGNLGAILVLAFVPFNKTNGQTAETLSQVKKVFVDSLGTEKGATELRDAMIKALRKDSDIQIVASASEADAVIIGSGKIWQTGSIRLGPHGSVSQPMYDGYLQADLKGSIFSPAHERSRDGDRLRDRSKTTTRFNRVSRETYEGSEEI